MTPEAVSLEDLFARFVDHHVTHGTCLSLDDLCRGNDHLREPLRKRIDRYLDLDKTLGRGRRRREEVAAAVEAPPPVIEGFQTIERLGGGGMGEVYKLRDLKLGRIVAAKFLRSGSRLGASLAGFLREAKSMALFQDRRIVQIFEFRTEPGDPVIIMEYVEGFELSRMAPSLEFTQRAHVLQEICDALHHAHGLGIQHRDLKPANLMLTPKLEPKILDFGLSGSDPARGHLRGTLHYLAPEQLDPGQTIDARTDVYALGVILYEMLCGTVPYDGSSTEDVIAAILKAQPRLPVEVLPGVPEPLQAIALKAMERDPRNRYQSTREMGLDLKRFIDGRPVLARPLLYVSVLGRRLRPHVEQIEEWLRLKLIYPHEAERLTSVYHRLESREDDWIVESRALSYSQIALYLGAFLMVSGSLLYFAADRIFKAVKGLRNPILVLVAPLVGLTGVAHFLYRKDHRAVAVAFYLAGVLLLPLALLILFNEAGLWVAMAQDESQFFTDGSVSNHQLQVAILMGLIWSFWLSLRTRTEALGTVFTILATLLTLALLTDLGLRSWMEQERFDRFGAHLVPLLLGMAIFGYWMEKAARPWFSRPLYLGGTVLLITILELLALNGRAFHYLGISMAPFQSADVSDPTLLDCLAAMSLNGIVFYLVGWVVDNLGSDLMRPGTLLLFVVCPFATLEPIAYLCGTEEYSERFDWFYLALSLAIILLSHHRQRKSFYYAGLMNIAAAIFLISFHRNWFDNPSWATVVIAFGLLVLGAGFALDVHERRRRRIGS